MTDRSVIVNILKKCRPDTSPCPRGAYRPSFARTWPSKNRRAQGMPGARRARSPACSVESTRGSHHGHAGTPGIPRAMVLTVSFAFSPATNSSCHRRAMLSGRIGFDSTGSPLAPATGVRTARLRRTHPASSSAFPFEPLTNTKCPPCHAQNPRRR
jgi:hypothetical protein